ncbi:four helix bundle protein [uncultured Chitinophaga sp.]|uniref:four helix bundle protein n=1 Tax=uncultured Chitinophaga sp. TaxID=339340 RepID=UPI0026363464|nr:four helix bundle protein [uncultured Chitinophaga sp.]
MAKINASGLTTQLRKASVSIDGNSAEGCATSTAAHFKKLLENAVGSAFAIETQLLIAAGGYVDLKENIEKILPVINEVQKMLNSLIEKLKQDSHKWLSANG